MARQPGDDPLIFAIELERLARTAFIDVDLKIQLQMVRYRFINGQVDCALCRHLDSLEPNTPTPIWTDTCNFLGDGFRGGHDQKTVADAGTSAFAGGPEAFGPPHTTTDGNDLPTNAGGAGANCTNTN